MKTQGKGSPLRTFVVLLALFLLLGVLFLMVALPQVYPDSEIIQTLFGGGRFAIFWVVIIVCLMIGVSRERRKIQREISRD